MNDAAGLIEARWPAVARLLESAPEPVDAAIVESDRASTIVVGGCQLSSAYDPRAEAELQARLVPADAARATVYGLGVGELPRVLLERSSLEHLRVVVLAPAAAAVSLANLVHGDWLRDPRVELVDGAACAELERPFAAAPACLRLADEGRARIRDLVELELATPHTREHLARRAELFARRIADNAGRLAADGDAAELFGAHAGATVWVAAAGPSLAARFGALRARKSDEPLLAVDAALKPLLAAGIVPDAVVSIDPDAPALELFFGDLPPEAHGVPLVYLPLVAGEVLDAWPGPRRAFYARHPRFADAADANPKATLYCSGSVIHPAVDLAVESGAARIVLCGADFANVGGRTHVAGASLERVATTASGAWVEGTSGERLPSYPNLVGYLRDLERYIARRPLVTFVNAGHEGARIAGTVASEEAA